MAKRTCMYYGGKTSYDSVFCERSGNSVCEVDCSKTNCEAWTKKRKLQNRRDGMFFKKKNMSVI